MKCFNLLHSLCLISTISLLAIGQARASETSELVTVSSAVPIEGPAENSSRETTELEVKPPFVSEEQKPDSDLTFAPSQAKEIETASLNKNPQKIQTMIGRMTTSQQSLEEPNISPVSASIPKLNEIEQPNTNVENLLAPQPSFTVSPGIQISQSVIQVTGVRLNPTPAGLEIVLETASGEVLEANTRTQGKTLIAEISNAQLALPDTQEFLASNPFEGITSVRVSNVDSNSIRISITGQENLPIADVIRSTNGLTLSVTADKEINITVTARQQTPYQTPNASSATRTDTPIRDIPASIQVVPQEVLRDRQVTRFDEALRNVSGVIYGGKDTNSEVRFSIRGFENAPTLIDGFRQFGFSEFIDPAGLERIEVLKGQASILYGEIQPGGVINAVTKKPLAASFYEAKLQIGSRGLFRPSIDFSGPLTSDGNLLYRLNALFSTENGVQDFDKNYRNMFVAPVLTWRISDRTDLTVELQYQQREKPFDADGTVALGRGVVDIPRDRVITEPDDDSVRNLLNVGYSLDHRFSNNWRIRNAFRYTSNSYFSDKLTILFGFDETTGDLTRVFAVDDFKSRDYSLQTYLVGNFATSSIKHTVLFGVDLNHNSSDSIAFANFDDSSIINIFNPVYRNAPRPPLTSLLFDTEIRTNRLGIYLQDQIAFADNLKLLLGLRYDALKQETNNDSEGFFASNDAEQSLDALTPRVGIVYQPIQPISLYASYSRSFTPSGGGFDESGNLLEPEKGEGFEVGIKADLIPDRLFATLAFFDITKQNVATNDPRFPLGGVSIATGEQRSQGVEFDLSGEILPGWNIIGSYAYTDAKVSKDNTTPEGNRLVGIPYNSLSLWTTYTIQSGSLEGLGVGMGVNYVGKREGDLNNSFQLASYFLTDAAIFYQRDNWRFAVNIKNLFNEKYYPGAPFGRTAGISVGEPFTVTGSVSVQF